LVDGFERLGEIPEAAMQPNDHGIGYVSRAGASRLAHHADNFPRDVETARRGPDRRARSRCRLARLVACALALISLAARADAQKLEDVGAWLGATATGKLPPSLNNERGSWRLSTDIQMRFGDNASRFSQGVLRSGVGYAARRGWTFWAGYAYIRTEAPYATVLTTEHRIWEQASWSGEVRSAALSSRTRLEQRFVSTGRETGWRLREQVKAVRPLGSQSIWSLVASDEYGWNLNSTDYGATAGPDRNRVFIGTGVKLSRTILIEVGYLNQYTFGTNGPDKNDHVFATNAFWSF
jgi:hypothetical protein